MTMISTAPSITNAIYNACGARVYHLPANPEKVKAALAKR
jgi:aldehyde oxidoreductase